MTMSTAVIIIIAARIEAKKNEKEEGRERDRQNAVFEAFVI